MSTPPEIVRIPLPTPFPVGSSNVFLIKGAEPVLIDTGTRTDEAYDRLVLRLREHGIEVRDLAVILVTHGHLDHIGLLSRLVEETRAKTYAHPYVLRQYGNYDEEVAENTAFIARAMAQFGAPVSVVDAVLSDRSVYRSYGGQVTIDHPLKDGETVGGLEAHFAPGHSASDIVYYGPGRRIAFTGDHLLKGMSPNPILRRPLEGEPRPKCLVEYLRSLRHTRSLDIEMCYPGHGASFGGHRAIVDNLLERHERRTREVKSLLSDGPLTPYEVVMKLFSKLTGNQLFFGLSLAAGHLEILAERGEIREFEQGGVTRYSLA